MNRYEGADPFRVVNNIYEQLQTQPSAVMDAATVCANSCAKDTTYYQKCKKDDGLDCNTFKRKMYCTTQENYGKDICKTPKVPDDSQCKKIDENDETALCKWKTKKECERKTNQYNNDVKKRCEKVQGTAFVPGINMSSGKDTCCENIHPNGNPTKKIKGRTVCFNAIEDDKENDGIQKDKNNNRIEGFAKEKCVWVEKNNTFFIVLSVSIALILAFIVIMSYK